MFALLNQDGTVARITQAGAGLQWRGFTLTSGDMANPPTRWAMGVLDFNPTPPGDAPIGWRWGDPIYTVNQGQGLVTEAYVAVQMDVEEAARQLASLREQRGREISAYRDNLHLTGGIKVGADWYGTDGIRRSQWLGLMLLGVNVPAGVNLYTLDGVSVPLTQALVQQIFTAIVVNDAAQVAAAQTHQAAMEDVADPRTYTAHQNPANWPPAYTPSQA